MAPINGVQAEDETLDAGEQELDDPHAGTPRSNAEDEEEEGQVSYLSQMQCWDLSGRGTA